MRIRVERHVQFSNCAIKTKQNALSGTVRVPHGLMASLDGNDELSVERIEKKAELN